VLRVFENRVLRVFENRVLRVFGNKVLRVFENRVLRVFENRVLRVFENKVLREIFGPRRDEVTGEWRGLNNEGLTDLYSSPSMIRATNQEEKAGWSMLHLREGDVHVRF